MYAPAHPEALVSTQVPSTALPLELRIFDAESAVEAARAIWVRRGSELDARPSATALRLAQWAGEDLRDAEDALESLRAEAVA